MSGTGLVSDSERTDDMRRTRGKWLLGQRVDAQVAGVALTGEIRHINKHGIFVNVGGTRTVFLLVQPSEIIRVVS